MVLHDSPLERILALDFIREVGSSYKVTELQLPVVEDTNKSIEDEMSTGKQAEQDKEPKTLYELGVLQFESAVEHDAVARQMGARFVKLKGIMAIKNAEMPAEYRKRKFRSVAYGCIVKEGDGRLAEPDPFPYDKPPGLMSIRAFMSY
ncbi:hypothetical protein FVE85_5101 [Porphyridium purpureum]|uniref:Uncharacterized protein n=1 Tax=Porphyridium purpureum TaxID=35688 RepID=A0A5J4Z1M0_PORPP|nr:hypothetical protein FVE85_5101 [Porphyridium purpureum]|eukprot:POR8144..scf295_1